MIWCNTENASSFSEVHLVLHQQVEEEFLVRPPTNKEEPPPSFLANNTQITCLHVNN